jgi:hypothetical protein
VCTRFTQVWLDWISQQSLHLNVLMMMPEISPLPMPQACLRGRDVVEEYLACRMFSLLASFGFGDIADGERPALKVTLPLPEFPLAKF